MRIAVFVVLFLTAYVSSAQTGSDSIFVSKSFLGHRFYQANERINFYQLPFLMEDNQEAYFQMGKAKNKHVLASIVSGAGVFLVGLQVANAIIGGEPNWVMAGVGGGLVVVSIPIFSSAYKQSKHAVDIHNAHLGSLREIEPQLLFGLSQSGLGFRYVF